MQFQSGYRVDELDIVKESFQRNEKALQMIKQWTLLTYSTVCVGLTVTNCIVLIANPTQYVDIVYTGLLLGGYIIIVRIYIYYRTKSFFVMRL